MARFIKNQTVIAAVTILWQTPKGTVGTVVRVLPENRYEVRFSSGVQLAVAANQIAAATADGNIAAGKMHKLLIEGTKGKLPLLEMSYYGDAPPDVIILESSDIVIKCVGQNPGTVRYRPATCARLHNGHLIDCE